MIPVGERKIVFGGIEGILRFHKDSFLPALETATKELIDSGDDATGDVSKRAATSVGQVFRTYNPFMRQYSAYINNFDFALQRLRKWTSHGHQSSPTSNVSSPGGIGVQMAAVGVGLGLAAVTPPATPDVQNPPSLPLSSSQRKRVRAFLHVSRANALPPLHVANAFALPMIRTADLTHGIAKSTWKAIYSFPCNGFQDIGCW